MRESVIYQEIQKEAKQQGRQEGREEGRQEGKEEGRQQEGANLVLRQLTRRLGQIAPEMRSQIQQLPIIQLEQLGEALLDFSSVQDLTDWLQGSSSNT